VLAQTASRVGAWDARLGYGIPDAAAAARRMLGTVAGAIVRNRATPLFRLRSDFTKDYAETTSPQYARALMITQVHNYTQPAAGTGAQPPVPGYAFSYDPQDPSNTHDTYESVPPAPRAAIYVLSTEYKPRSGYPDLIPLYLMTKNKTGGRDHLLATPATMAVLHNSGGYDLWTIQGYIYQPCTPEPAGVHSAVCGEAMAQMQDCRQRLRDLSRKRARRLRGGELHGSAAVHQQCLARLCLCRRRQRRRRPAGCARTCDRHAQGRCGLRRRRYQRCGRVSVGRRTGE
jgi:hypothetical protein